MTEPPGDPDRGPDVAVLLVSARWSAPARPATTVLRELARRWGPAILPLLLEDADEDMLDRLGIDTVPTWLRLSTCATSASTGGSSATTIRDLSVPDLLGNRVVLEGAWQITHRRSGALPKHVVAEEFGPPTQSGP